MRLASALPVCLGLVGRQSGVNREPVPADTMTPHFAALSGKTKARGAEQPVGVNLGPAVVTCSRHVARTGPARPRLTFLPHVHTAPSVGAAARCIIRVGAAGFPLVVDTMTQTSGMLPDFS